MWRQKNYNKSQKPKKKSLLGVMFRVLLLSLNVLAAIALLFSFLSSFFPPSFSVLMSYCGLAFPYILIVNFVFVVLWLIFNYKYSLISLFLILINVNNVDRCFQLRATPKPEVCASCVKVMSYNAKLFGLYDVDTKAERDRNLKEVFDLLAREKPEILCIQEFFCDGSGKLKFPTTDTIMNILNLYDKKRNCYQYFYANNTKRDYHYGMAVFSRYRILNGDFVDMGDSSANSSIYVDIKYRSDTIRIYNVHLTSIHMDEEDYAIGRDISANGIDDPNLDKKAKILYRKIGKAFVERQHQVRALRTHIDSCNYPVIICGDFNDSPVSYAYRKVSHGFKDAYRESGEGRGQTYFGDAFPSFRIDYILHDKRYKSFGYTTYDSLTVSDHYPIWTNISLLK